MKYFLALIGFLFFACEESKIEAEVAYNFAAKVSLKAKDVEILEAEFENLIEQGIVPNDLKYFQVAIRYKDKRTLPYLKWIYQHGDQHLKAMAIYSIGGINDSSSIAFLRSLSIEKGIVQTYRNSALELYDGSTYNAFDTLPILDRRNFIKEPFLFKGVSDTRLELNTSKVDSSITNTSLVKDFIPPTKYFHDSLPHTPLKNNFWFDSGSSYHSGLDNSWDWPGLPVVNAMDGKVKLIWFDLSWGVMIAIESQYNGEWLTQIYGHLGNEIFVAVGDYISAGKQIGFIGKGMTVTNGGYRAHLHYGIEKCKFESCNLSGYALEKTNWINPKELFSENH